MRIISIICCLMYCYQPRPVEWLLVYGPLRYTWYSLCKHILTSSIVSFPCPLAVSVMQLKKFFIANAGVTILVITNAKAATMPMIASGVVRCMINESHNINILIDSLNQFTIRLIHCHIVIVINC